MTNCGLGDETYRQGKYSGEKKITIQIYRRKTCGLEETKKTFQVYS